MRKYWEQDKVGFSSGQKFLEAQIKSQKIKYLHNEQNKRQQYK